MDALRCSAAVTPIRLIQPWSRAGAGGLPPIVLAPGQRSCCPGVMRTNTAQDFVTAAFKQ